MSPREKKIGCGFGCLFVILFMIIASVFGVDLRLFGPNMPYTGWRSFGEMIAVLGDKYEYPSYLPDSVSRDFGAFTSPRNKWLIDDRQKYDDGYSMTFYENKNYRNKEIEPFIRLPTHISVVCYKPIASTDNYSSREHKYSLTEYRELFIRGEPYQVEFYFCVYERSQFQTIFSWWLDVNYFYVKDDFEYRIFVSCGNVNDSNIISEEETYELFLLHKDAAIDHLGNELIKIAESMKPASEILR